MRLKIPLNFLVKIILDSQVLITFWTSKRYKVDVYSKRISDECRKYTLPSCKLSFILLVCHMHISYILHYSHMLLDGVLMWSQSFEKDSTMCCCCCCYCCNC